MSSKQDKNYEKKIAEEAAKGENIDDMGKIINVKGPPIKFPNETWEEIVMWCKRRMELAERVSLVNDLLFCISYKFMHEEKGHPLPFLRIFGDNNREPWMGIRYPDESWKDLSKSEVPNDEIPLNITARNNKLDIRAIDKDVLKFIQFLAPIYSVIDLSIDVKSEDELSKPEMKELIGLFSGKVQALSIKEKIAFSEFHKSFASDLKDLFSIYISREMTEQEYFILKDWLYQPREDGRIKIVQIRNFTNRKFVGTIKEDFLTADEQTSFVIDFKYVAIYGNDEDLSFDIVNSDTKERLTFDDNGTIIRLSQDYPDSPDEMFDKINASLQRLPKCKYKHGDFDRGLSNKLEEE